MRSELRQVTSDTDAAHPASQAKTEPPQPEPSTGRDARRWRKIVTLCSLLALPVAAIASACGDSSDGDVAANGGDGVNANGTPDGGVAGDVSASAGTGGAAATGAGGGGGNNAESMGGSGPLSLAGAAGNMSMSSDAGESGAAPGETGVFIGMTAAHNAARAAEMLDPPLPDLTWSNDLAAVAQDWADTLAKQCGTIMHRMPNKYGENIAEEGSTGPFQYTAAQAVDSWVSEKMCWDYGTINGTEQCDTTCYKKLSSTGCGHYTQVVWRNTQRVGCGFAQCQAAGGFTDDLWVCNYDPPGNYVGQAPY
jgi:pathogenesis-related protein 1